MRPSDLQHKELQRVTMIELQAKVAELEDKNESLTSQNSELIKKTYGLELEKQELADEVLWVKTINLKLKKNWWVKFISILAFIPCYDDLR